MISVHTVAGFRDDLAIYRKESTEWVISLTAGFFCQCKGSGEQGTVIHAVEVSQSRPPGPSIVSSASAARPGTHMCRYGWLLDGIGVPIVARRFPTCWRYSWIAVRPFPVSW